ncbi:MAG: hypothetical protein M3Z25_04930 [Actinomycetota bacterium]|nr:hypothetical protein [Actinomycetota bacterium]
MRSENTGDDQQVILLECPASWPGAEDVARAGRDVRLVHAISAETRSEGDDRSGISVPQFVEYILHVDQVWQSVRGPFSYAVGAAASGVIGNYAYDVLKGLFGRYDKGPTPPTPPTTAEPAQRLALLAVRVRCAELGLPMPPFKTLQVVEIRAAAGVWTVRVAGGDLLDAEVSLPIEPILHDEPVTVLLRMRLPPTEGRRLE